jgi:hypothetical protein
VAPVKQVIKTGDAVDLRELPIVRHHGMDPAPYIDMTPVMRDPDKGQYNVAFLRTMYKGPRKLGIHMSPRHNWQIARKYEAMNRPTPVVIVVSHHPAFYLGALNVSPFGVDDYELVGSMMDAPLRLVPSETWGEEFMVPADAELVIEGEIPSGVREVEGPFGEFPGTYGPQRLRWVIDVKAVTHRRDAIYQDIFVGHPDNWVLGAIPKEGTLYNRIKGVVPGVKVQLLHLHRQAGGRREQAGGADRARRMRLRQARGHRRRRRRSLQRAGGDVGVRDPRAGGSGRRHHQEREGQHPRPLADRRHHDREDDHRRDAPGAPPVRPPGGGAAGGPGAVPGRALPQIIDACQAAHSQATGNL